MTSRRLHDSLTRLDGAPGLVAAGAMHHTGLAAGATIEAWRAAAAEAKLAYEAWRTSRDAGSYAVYRASADRADAAQDALAKRTSRR